MPQLRDKLNGAAGGCGRRMRNEPRLEGFSRFRRLVHAKLDGLVDLDVARFDEGLQHPLGHAALLASGRRAPALENPF